MARMRALADARARWERSAPPVMLAASATFRNNRISVRSKRIEPAGEEKPAFGNSEGRVAEFHIVAPRTARQRAGVLRLLFIAVVFVLAGGVKGVNRLGLPTVPGWLLRAALPPAGAAGLPRL